MKELIKKALIALPGLALLAGTSFAAVGNSGTGENSLNKVEWEGRNETRLDVDNDADVDNDLDVFASTGNNEIKGMNENEHDSHGHDKHDRNDREDNNNESAGDKTINTGDADASADVTNRVNRTTIDAAMPGMGMGDVGNMDTGRNSENRVEAEQHNSLNVDIDNDADVDNDVDVNATTGCNTINAGGRGDATINTGNASASATVTNEVNTTSVTVR